MQVPTIILIVSCVLGVHGHDNHTETDPQPQPSEAPAHDYCLFGVKEGVLNGECRIGNGVASVAIVGVCLAILAGTGFLIYFCRKQSNENDDQADGKGISICNFCNRYFFNTGNHEPIQPPPYKA